jgi:hypothetical protein
MRSQRLTTLGLLAAGLVCLGAIVPFAWSSPAAEVPAGPEVWVTAQDGAKILVVRGTRTVATIDLPAGTSPHFTRFSSSGRYVYVPGLGFGDVTVIRARDRKVVATIPIAPATPPAQNSNPKLPGGLGVHDAVPSPDGRAVLAVSWSDRTLYKITADEAAENWTVAQKAQLANRPICAVYHPSGTRAYVGTVPNGIQIVDVASLQVLKSLPTTGPWSCSSAQTSDRRTMYASTVPGFVYRIDLVNDEISDLGLSLGSMHIHGLGLSRDGTTLYLTSREDDSMRLVALDRGNAVTTVPLDATFGVPDRPDSVAVLRNTVWMSLRSSGKLAIFNSGNPEAVRYVELQPVCPPSENLCYAIHSVELRPDREPPTSRIAQPTTGKTFAGKRPITVRGTAIDQMSPIASIELALRLRTATGCKWWNGRQLVARSCKRQRWFSARGNPRWTYRFGSTLPAGSYGLNARATDSEGNRETSVKIRRNLVQFRIR